MAKAKADAAAKGVSMNTILREAIRKGLGIADAPKTNGLERFSGSCPDHFSPEWKKKESLRSD